MVYCTTRSHSRAVDVTPVGWGHVTHRVAAFCLHLLASPIAGVAWAVTGSLYRQQGKLHMTIKWTESVAISTVTTACRRLGCDTVKFGISRTTSGVHPKCRYACTRVLISSLAVSGRKQATAIEDFLSFIYPIYNHNWRNISTIYITRLASNEIFSPSNKIHREVGRAKDLSAPLYQIITVILFFSPLQVGITNLKSSFTVC